MGGNCVKRYGLYWRRQGSDQHLCTNHADTVEQFGIIRPEFRRFDGMARIEPVVDAGPEDNQIRRAHGDIPLKTRQQFARRVAGDSGIENPSHKPYLKTIENPHTQKAAKPPTAPAPCRSGLGGEAPRPPVAMYAQRTPV